MSPKDRYDIKKIKAAARQTKGSEPQNEAQYRIPEPMAVLTDPKFKPQQILNPRTNQIVAFLVFISTLIVYMLTQARTMSFWDSGEYATCISILGVPHPPGNPFYIVFGRAVVALLGSLFTHAVLAAFISGLTSALAVMFTYLITVKLVSMWKSEKWEIIFAGVVAALFTAYSFTFWMNAIEAEVYSGLVFFVNIIFWLTLVWVEKAEDFSHQNIFLLIVYLFFLGFCVHQTALQIAPAMLFIVLYPLILKSIKGSNFWIKAVAYSFALVLGYVIFGAIGANAGIDEFDKWAFAAISAIIVFYELHDIIDRRVWLLALGLILIGLSSHLYLMIRAAQRPFINEGHPSTLKMFSDYVLRKQYGNTNFFVRRGSFFGDQMGYHFFRYFGIQWFNIETLSNWLRIPATIIQTIGSLIIALLGSIGAYFHYQKNKHSFAYYTSVLIFTTVVMVFVMNLSNAEVRDRDYFFVVAYNMWAIWLGIGSLAIASLLKQKAFKYAMVAVLCALPLVNFVSQYNIHDRSNEYIALDYGLNFLNSLEENAIIITNGDNDTFPLWYAQAVHDPHSIEHVHSARDIYPTPESEAAIQEAMRFKNKYLKGIRKDVSVANLSLLNTPWYIKQLRDREGVLFGWTDEQIDRLTIVQGPMNIRFGSHIGDPEKAFEIAFQATPPWRKAENFYRVSDIATIQMIRENYGKRPIYFAVTCENFVGFDDYLRNEGMVSRLVATQNNDQIDIDRLIENITQIYQYRSIEDDRVYKDENMQRLVMNYGSGFVRAATHYAEYGEIERASALADQARTFIDTDLKLTDFLVRYYSGQNRWEELDAFISKEIFSHSEGWKIYFSFILAYLLDAHPDHVEPYIRKAILQYPDNYFFAEFAVRYAKEFGKQDEIITLLNELRPQIRFNLNEYFARLNERE